MAKIVRKRSVWGDLLIAGLASSAVPAVAVWQSRSQAHAEAMAREADDQAYRMAMLAQRGARLRMGACDAALDVSAVERAHPSAESSLGSRTPTAGDQSSICQTNDVPDPHVGAAAGTPRGLTR